MTITKEDVLKIAYLSRILIPEDELQSYCSQLGSILEYVQKLDALDTTAIEPTSHVIPLVNVMREDVVTKSLSRDTALSNAPQATDKFYKTPKIIE